jgi:hypothetical protein
LTRTVTISWKLAPWRGLHLHHTLPEVDALVHLPGYEHQNYRLAALPRRLGVRQQNKAGPRTNGSNLRVVLETARVCARRLNLSPGSARGAGRRGPRFHSRPIVTECSQMFLRVVPTRRPPEIEHGERRPHHLDVRSQLCRSGGRDCPPEASRRVPAARSCGQNTCKNVLHHPAEFRFSKRF